MESGRHKEDLRAMLMRIVALLFCLADDAERAAGQPRAIRCAVMAILRRAEACAETLVLREAKAAGVWVVDMSAPESGPESEPTGYSDGPADALYLAAGFRALALVLNMLAARIISGSQTGFSGRRAACPDTRPGQPAGYSQRAVATLGQSYPDTS